MSGVARFAGIEARNVVETRHDAAALHEPGFWVVLCTFEGELTAVRMEQVRRYAEPAPTGQVEPLVADPDLRAWSGSLDRSAYERGVRDIRERIAAGTVYQVNLCRVLSRVVPAGFKMGELDQLVRQANPAPRHAFIDLPEARLEVVCASPELYLRREGDRLTSAPIKGTAPTAGELLPKDRTENVMITDLVRNDLSAVCRPGTVGVDALLAEQHHPDLVHLESTVSGELREGAAWADILAATFPPGSVSGAPKSSALTAIRELEPVERGPYCGAIGYVDNEAGSAELAVGIRTFWLERDRSGARWLRYGTGAGITWGSEPYAEWCETVLKARRLLALAESVIARTE